VGGPSRDFRRCRQPSSSFGRSGRSADVTVFGCVFPALQHTFPIHRCLTTTIRGEGRCFGLLQMAASRPDTTVRVADWELRCFIMHVGADGQAVWAVSQAPELQADEFHDARMHACWYNVARHSCQVDHSTAVLPASSVWLAATRPAQNNTCMHMKSKFTASLFLPVHLKRCS
jgi:hypothetical protein